jgi:uncharacterized membrane protein
VRMKYLMAVVLVVSALSPLLAHALTQPEPSNQVSVEYLEKSRVTQASPSTTKLLEGTSINQTFQSLTIEILEGPDKGKTTTFKNDYTQLKAGDLFYVRHTVGGFDPETWSVSDPYRLNVLLAVSIAFVLLLLLIGGFQGVRALASLAGSIVLIFYVLLPGIIGGVSPILVSVGVASLIIILGSYITHGFSRTTTVAMVSMIVTVVFTGIATYFVIHADQLSGFTTEENAYLNFGASGKIDMIGLLFGGILIGLLGVLYDIAIGQAIAVEELIHAAAHYTKQQIFRRGMRIGREHIGALVNTLAIAYVGASLPLLLLFKQTSSASDVLYIINSERFATEIIRILMGSGGLVLAVPITTLLATYALHGRVKKSTGHAHAH